MQARQDNIHLLDDMGEEVEEGCGVVVGKVLRGR
jgi:hypothetical protein